MLIQDAVAVVTGANRGIGKSLVEELLARGAKKVYAAGKRSAELGKVVALDPARVFALELDITNAEAGSAAAAAAADANLLINNAGVLDFGSVLDAPEAAFARNLEVNFYGLLRTTRAFAPVLERNGGTVVNVLTLVALASMPGLGVYNASKAAAWSLTQSLRADLAKRGVRVVGVFPGAVDTDMLAGVEMPKASPRSIAEAVIQGVEAEAEDVFPDAMSQQLYSAWKADHKAVEKQFASM